MHRLLMDSNEAKAYSFLKALSNLVWETPRLPRWRCTHPRSIRENLRQERTGNVLQRHRTPVQEHQIRQSQNHNERRDRRNREDYVRSSYQRVHRRTTIKQGVRDAHRTHIRLPGGEDNRLESIHEHKDTPRPLQRVKHAFTIILISHFPHTLFFTSP